MATWITGEVIENKHWHGGLYSLRVSADIAGFQAGQFAKLGLEIGAEIIGRPYSLVNPPGSQPLEFYYMEIDDGPLTPHLARLQSGDKILVDAQAHGFMVLDEVPQAEHLWLMATGTGIGPFLSMLATAAPLQRFNKIVLVYAVRHAADLSYLDTIQSFAAAHGDRFSFISLVSREQQAGTLDGRIPLSISDGRLEAAAGVQLDAAHSQVLLCGNPEMIKDTMAVLAERGMKRHRRRDPGQITTEDYW